MPDAHVHRHSLTGGVEPEGDPISRPPRADVERRPRDRRLPPRREASLLPQRRGRRAHLRARGRRGRSRRSSAGCRSGSTTTSCPARHDVPLRARRRAADVARFHTPGEIETPTATATATASCSSTRPTRSGTSTRRVELETHRERGEFELVVRVRGGLQRYRLDYHPFDVVGWDGYVYPYTFNVHDFEPRHRAHPPAAAGAPDLPGAELRDLLVLPARARLGPRGGADPLPPLEPPVGGGHLLRLRRLRQPQGIEVGSVTVHPSGLPHGRSPGWQRPRSASAAPRSSR